MVHAGGVEGGAVVTAETRYAQLLPLCDGAGSRTVWPVEECGDGDGMAVAVEAGGVGGGVDMEGDDHVGVGGALWVVVDGLGGGGYAATLGGGRGGGGVGGPGVGAAGGTHRKATIVLAVWAKRGRVGANAERFKLVTYP